MSAHLAETAKCRLSSEGKTQIVTSILLSTFFFLEQMYPTIRAFFLYHS